MSLRLRLLALGFALAAPALLAHEENSAQLDALIAQNPDCADLLLLRAEHHESHAEWALAEADVRGAAALESETPRVALALGRIAFGRGAFAEARKRFDAVLARMPDDAETRVWRARTQVKLGDDLAAEADYSRALALVAQPTPELFLERAKLALPPAKLLAGLDEGLAKLGPVVALLERALALELGLGRTEAALARLDALAATAERRETWLKRRGDILAAAGRSAEARASYAAALEAIQALPAWLRETPETAALAATLSQLTSTRS